MSSAQSLALSLGAWLRTAVSTQSPLHCGGFRAASGHGAQINGTAYVLCHASRRVAHQPRCLVAVVLPVPFAKTTNKSSRAVASSAVMDREPPSVHCLITRWGLSFININSFKMCVGGQVSDLKIDERKKKKILPSASTLHRNSFLFPCHD